MAALAGCLLLGLALTGCSVIEGGSLNDAQQVIADIKIGPAAPKPGELRLTIAADRPDESYGEDEPIVLTLAVSKPASVAVVRVLRSGLTTLVFPNRAQPEAQLAADAPVAVRVPAGTSGPQLFKAVASTGGDSWLFSRKPPDGAQFAALGATSRAIAKEILGSLRTGELASAQLVVRVR